MSMAMLVTLMQAVPGHLLEEHSSVSTQETDQ